ncbi:hypothetical protein PIB30_083821 [Stylosanthes scabra]|uniref:Uncharacterized protein n=1 Tax=Stylosanthes scabra TaxID=79078 RepID=A0ABU6SSK5_9FABA|nr:hypothetical protein [Stylosanthes scabra]
MILSRVDLANPISGTVAPKSWRLRFRIPLDVCFDKVVAVRSIVSPLRQVRLRALVIRVFWCDLIAHVFSEDVGVREVQIFGLRVNDGTLMLGYFTILPFVAENGGRK